MPITLLFEISGTLFEKTKRHNPKLFFQVNKLVEAHNLSVSDFWIFEIFAVFEKVALFCLWLSYPDLGEKGRLPPISFKLRRNMLNNMADSIMAIRDEFEQTLYRKSQIKITINFATIGKITLLCRKLRKFKNPRPISCAPRRAY